MSLFLHVGTGKTGSSALQAWFSSHVDGSYIKDVLYAGLRRELGVLVGDQLREHSIVSPHGYCVSDIRGWLSRNKLDAFSGEIIKIAGYAQSTNLLISDETIWSEPEVIKEFARLFAGKVDVKVVFVFRPILGYLRSAWWQWWQWINPQDSFMKFARHDLVNYIKFRHSLEAIKNLESGDPCISLVTRILRGDIVDLMLDVIGIDGRASLDARKMTNVSAGPNLISIYKRYPQFRSPHDGWLDSLISGIIPEVETSPWPFCKDNSHELIRDNIYSISWLGNFLDSSDSCNPLAPRYIDLSFAELDLMPANVLDIPPVNATREIAYAKLIKEGLLNSHSLIPNKSKLFESASEVSLEDLLATIGQCFHRF